MSRIKRGLIWLLTIALMLSVWTVPALAKTTQSEKAENIFFYTENAQGKSVLLKVMTLDELSALSHGQANGDNYYVSATDNYPTPQYGEARGFTVTELVDYVKSVTTVSGANKITFTGEDSVKLMATDSYGNYNRTWSYNELYGVTRYYFEGLYDSAIGWNTGWEITGEDSSKFGVTMEQYNAQYRDSDPYYENKRAVFDDGVVMEPILATVCYSGRTTSETLVASTEPGIAGYLKANGGVAAGSLSEVLSDAQALRLMLPITEADLMAAHRTAYDNFKWIYNIQLIMENAPSIVSEGTVEAPVPSFTLNGNTLTITFSCATAGASIYYGFEGAAQTLYTGPVEVDVTGRDLDSDPITVYAAAVKEGYDDAGMQTFKYPGMAPAFQTVYSGMTGAALTLTAAEGVTAAEWTAWTGALNFVSAKTPSVSGYVTLDAGKYTIDNANRTITFDKSLFADAGSYSFIFHNTRYANKNVSVTMKTAAPELSAPESSPVGQALTVTFNDESYTRGLSVYVTPENGKRTMISATYLDRTQAGQVTIRAEYFALDSCVMDQAGSYEIELVNSGYSPSSQTVTVRLTGGFSDVSTEAWYYTYVTELAERGIVNGVGGGKFDPDGTLDWGSALKQLMLSCGYEEQTATTAYWASGYIDRAAADGLIAVGTDGTAKITRLEFCQTAAKLLGAETTLTDSPFTDCADADVLALYEWGIINGIGNNQFGPDGVLDRAQISTVIWRILNLEEME